MRRGSKRSGRLPTRCAAMLSTSVWQPVSSGIEEANPGRKLLSVCSVPLKLICPGWNLRFEGRQRHHATDQIVRQEVHGKLVPHTVRRLAAQVIHLQHDFETPQVELGLPTTTVELGDLVGRIRIGVDERRHDHQRLGAEATLRHADTHLAQHQLVRQRRIRVGRHPLGPLRLGEPHQVIVFAESLARAKVGGPQLMLADHDVDAALGEQGDVEPAAEIAVREHHVAVGESVSWSVRNKLFSPVCFPSYWPMAASSTVPTANENTTSTRAIGRPQPAACVLACGYSAWFSGVSGMVIVEPSTTRTRRPCQNHSRGAWASSSRPLWRTNSRQAVSGKASRAVQ